jgi:hypothetical protein
MAFDVTGDPFGMRRKLKRTPRPTTPAKKQPKQPTIDLTGTVPGWDPAKKQPKQPDWVNARSLRQPTPIKGSFRPPITTAPKGAKPAPKAASTRHVSRTPVAAAAPTAPATSPKKPKLTKPKKPARPAATTAVTPNLTPAAPDTTIDDIFGPAFEELDKTKAGLEAGRTGQLADIGAYSKWLSDENKKAQDWASAQWDDYRKAAEDARAPLADEAKKREAETAGITGGNADLERLTGIDTVQAQQGIQAGVDKTNATQGDVARAALASSLTGTGEAARAQSANMLALVNSDYNTRLRALDTSRAGLTVDKGKLALANKQAAAKLAQDQAMLELVTKEKLGNLDVAQENAKTRRLQVLTTASLAKTRNQLMADIAAGRLTIQKARLELDTAAKAAGLDIQNRKLELSALNLGSRQVADAQKYIDAQYERVYGVNGTRKWDQDRTKDRQFVRQVITQMRSRLPGLTNSGAVALINGRFPGALRRDPADKYPLIDMVNALWPPAR